MAITKQDRRVRIKRRIRKVVKGTAQRPRLSVFRSNKEIYAQLIDDVAGKTIVSAGSLSRKQTKKAEKADKTGQASGIGKSIAEAAVKAGITVVVFDRNGYQYQGRVKALAEAAREGGLKF